ncbi:MAG: N-acetylneuraminate synthase family protein [Ferrovibrio sp.]
MVKFGKRILGTGHPCFITYEAGPTHNGLASAKRLVSLAASCGADAVKFQMVDPDRLVADRSVTFDYEILVDRATGRMEPKREPLHDIFVRRALTQTEWKELKAHADREGVAFFCTAGFPDEVEFLQSLGCDSIKIASSDVNHLPLIRQVARTGMCVQLDTGNSTIGEIEAAIEVIRAEGNENIIIHHCPSGYPARIDGINLRIITTLKRMFDYPIAFSDHSPGWEMDVAAVALGANLVEKTITEDRTTPSVEHVFSLEPNDMKQFVQVIRDVEGALGRPRRIMSPKELERRQAMRRSTHLASAATKGTRVADLAVTFSRPGYGLSPADWERFGSAILRRDLPAGHLLTPSDFE